jgi:hypothetical protein
LFSFFNIIPAGTFAAQEAESEQSQAQTDPESTTADAPSTDLDCGRGCGCKGLRVRLSTWQKQIDWGDTARLYWRCRKTESCELTPEVEELRPRGFGVVCVSPKQTTQYTLTGKRAGCTRSASVTITVVNIPPTISIIQPAHGSRLSLGTADAVPVEIQYSDNVGIDVASFTVRLNNREITDLFSVTDTGAAASLTLRLPAGENTLSATISDTEDLSRTAASRFTVTYLPPTVHLSAEPPTCRFGESTTLSWHTTNADKVTIEPNIGEVGLNDSMAVTLYQKSTYTITATGPGGTVTDSLEIDVTDIPPPGIYYEYDPLGRMKRIIRMPASQSP